MTYKLRVSMFGSYTYMEYRRLNIIRTNQLINCCKINKTYRSINRSFDGRISWKGRYHRINYDRLKYLNIKVVE